MTQADMEIAIAEIWKLFKETREQISETSKMVAETSKRMAETSKRSEATDRKLERLIGKWGIFVENVIAPGVPRIFRERNIEIARIHKRSESKDRKGKQIEIDIIGANGEYVVAVSVKSTLSVDDVKDHLDDLARFKECFPEYASKKLLGAVAGISIAYNVEEFACKHGLFVIGQSGDMAVCLNDEKFKPNEW